MLNDHTLSAIPVKQVKSVNTTLEVSEASVKINGEVTLTFDINNGIRQEDVLLQGALILYSSQQCEFCNCRAELQ